MNYSQDLLIKALEELKTRKDEKSFSDQIASAILDKGVENLGPCLAVLNERQIMALTKKLMRNMTRDVYYKFEAIRRQEQEAVAGRGVDGIENPFQLTDVDGGEHNPYGEAMAYQAALEDVHTNLHIAFMAAEKIVLGWQDGYQLQGLPYYSSQNDDGNTWHDCHSFEEAAARITRDRVLAKERQAAENKASLNALANLSF